MDVKQLNKMSKDIVAEKDDENKIIKRQNQSLKSGEIGLLKNNARIKVLVSCLKNSETILDFGLPTRLSGKEQPANA